MRLKLSEEELNAVRELAEASDVRKGGERYPPGFIETSFADTPPL